MLCVMADTVTIEGVLATPSGVAVRGWLEVGCAVGVVADSEKGVILTGTERFQADDAGLLSVTVLRPSDGFVPLTVLSEQGRVLLKGAVEIPDGSASVDLAECLDEVGVYSGRPSYVSVAKGEKGDPGEPGEPGAPGECQLPLWAAVASWTTVEPDTPTVVSAPYTKPFPSDQTAFVVGSAVQARGLEQAKVVGTVVGSSTTAVQVSIVNESGAACEVRARALVTTMAGLGW